MSHSTLAHAIDAIYAEPAREILREPLPGGESFKVLHQEADGSFTVHDLSADGTSRLVQVTPHADQAARTFEAYDGPRPWHAAYLPRGENGATSDKTVRVHAAGADPEACIIGFLDSLGQTLKPGSLAPLPAEVGEREFQWGLRFQDAETGTAFKAAGRLVPGGAVMTWWK